MFNTLIIEPFTNLMLLTYQLVGDNFVLSIVLLTVLIRAALIPLTARQQANQKKMQEMQPQLKEVQDKYRDDPQRMQEELQKIGYNPISMVGGGCLPLFIQMPIWIGLYRSILYAIPNGPVAMMDLYNAHYTALFPNFNDVIPVASQFLWFDLSAPDRLFITAIPALAAIGIPILPILVGLTTWLQQKVMTPPPSGDANDQSAQMARSMMVTMPLMLAFFAYQFASGLSIYFIVSNFMGILQFTYMNRERLEWKPTGVPLIYVPEFKPPEDPKASRRAAARAGSTASPVENSKPVEPPKTPSRRKKAMLTTAQTSGDGSSSANGSADSGGGGRKKKKSQVRSRRRR